MSDLISRSALLEKKTRMTEYDETGCGVHVYVVRAEDVEAAPAVNAVPMDFHESCLVREVHRRFEVEQKLKDAEPVRHGLWIRPTFDPAWVKCSECGCYWEGGIVENGNMYYCPNCGAKMDAEVRE